MNSFLQEIPIDNKNVSLNILRLDKVQPYIQGNKFYKLFYNIDFAIQHNLSILTFGGAYSNHIHATALACQRYGIPCIGIIRGDNFKYESTTLKQVKEFGMQLFHVERSVFKEIRILNKTEIKKWISNEFNIHNKLHIIPEGGTNELGIKGSKKILEEIENEFDYVCCPVGTGGTISGIINCLKGEKRILGFSSLKDNYLKNKVANLTANKYTNWVINFSYHFGGYAKWNMDLIDFINDFKRKNKIPLCPIYTGKMVYGILDLIKQNYFPKDSTILAVHTGGLQGINNFNQANGNILI